MTKVLTILSDYGVELNTTLNRFAGDEELYIDCLLDFISDKNFKLLESAMEEKDYPAAFQYAHTLKGVSGNLGLTPLYKAVCDLTEPLRNKKYEAIHELYLQVKDQHHRLHIILKQ